MVSFKARKCFLSQPFGIALRRNWRSETGNGIVSEESAIMFASFGGNRQRSPANTAKFLARLALPLTHGTQRAIVLCPSIANRTWCCYLALFQLSKKIYNRLFPSLRGISKVDLCPSAEISAQNRIL